MKMHQRGNPARFDARASDARHVLVREELVTLLFFVVSLRQTRARSSGSSSPPRVRPAQVRLVQALQLSTSYSCATSSYN